MKLIKASTAQDETVEVKLPAPSALGRLMHFAKTGEATPQVKTSYQGRRTWSNCYIQYGVLLPAFSLLESRATTDVVFGSELYRGVRPLRHLGDTVYECAVDAVIEVIIGQLEDK